MHVYSIVMYPLANPLANGFFMSRYLCVYNF